MYSYRDPQLNDTLGVYSNIYQFLQSYQLNKENQKNLIISSIGSMDQHLLPSQVGTFNLDLYLQNISLQQRQSTRDQIFQLSQAKINRFAKYLSNFGSIGVESIFTNSTQNLPKSRQYKAISL
ncbi:MAG: hypothetical protein HC932_03305 [Thermales bacterium]|nr:hypothetical protein [Thermales bacterium]